MQPMVTITESPARRDDGSSNLTNEVSNVNILRRIQTLMPTMKVDGSAKSQIGAREQGNAWKPSYQLHDGQRWFLNIRDTGALNAYDEMIQELFAHTADGDLVQVTNDPDLYVDAPASLLSAGANREKGNDFETVARF
jgi:hypothetical protein